MSTGDWNSRGNYDVTFHGKSSPSSSGKHTVDGKCHACHSPAQEPMNWINWGSKLPNRLVKFVQIWLVSRQYNQDTLKKVSLEYLTSMIQTT